MERPFKPPRGCKPQGENYCSSFPSSPSQSLSLAEVENAEMSRLVHAQASVSCEPLDCWPPFKGRAIWFGVCRNCLQVNCVRVCSFLTTMLEVKCMVPFFKKQKL